MQDNTAAMSSLYARMAAIFVPHPRFVELLDDIKATIALHGASDELPCLHVSGPSGVGKTTLVKKLMASYPVERDARRISDPPFENVTADHIPVLRIEMPPQPTVVSIAQEMLKAFGDPNWFKATAFTQFTCGSDHALIPFGLCGFGGRCWSVEKALLVVLAMSVARLWEPG